jgi:ArsR family transcriptional regulator
MKESKEGLCEVLCIHPEKVSLTKDRMLDETVVHNLAATFKALGDPTRVRILHALSIQELCVCDLAAALEMNQSAISHQLRLLRNLHLVKFRKEGKVVYYSLDDEHIIELFGQGLAHVQHQ